jgi:hypothetical protein
VPLERSRLCRKTDTPRYVPRLRARVVERGSWNSGTWALHFPCSGAEISSCVRARDPLIRCSDKPVAGGRVDEACSQPPSPELPSSFSARRILYSRCNWRSSRGQDEVKSWRDFRNSSRERFGVSEGNRAIRLRIFTSRVGGGI